MDKGRIEKKIADRLSDHSVYIDKDQLWKDLENKKKKRRFPILWFFGGASLLGLLAMLLWINSEDVTSDPILPLSDSSVVEKKHNNTEEKDETSSNTILNNDEQLLDSPLLTKSPAQEKSILRPVQKDPIKKVTNPDTNPATIATSKNSVIIEDNKAVETESTQNIISGNNQTIHNDSSEDITHHVEILNQTQIVTDAPSPNDTTTTTTTTTILKDKNTTVDPISQSEVEEVVPSEEKNEEKPIENILKRNKTRHFIEITSGYGIVNHSFHSKNENYTHWKNARSSAITPMENLFVGVHYGRELAHNFYLASGIEWHLLQERFTGSYTSMDTIQMPGITSYVQHPDGMITEEMGLISKITLHDWNYDVYNKFMRWNIPVKLGYRIKMNKWELRPELGCSFNLHMSKKVYDYNQDLEVVDNPDHYRSRATINVHFGTTVDYFLNDNNSFNMGIAYTIKPFNLSSLDDFEDRIRILQFSGGYRFHF